MQKVHDSSNNHKWEDYPSIESPIIADDLNRHETELDEIDNRVVVHETTKANQTDLLTCVASITLNSTTGILTITLKNGSSTTIDTGLSKLAVNFDYDADPESEHYQQLILVMKDGSKKYIDLSALITQFEFKNSATITWTVGNDGTVTANIINGSITEEMLETNFLANCRLEVSKALGFSQDAEAWAKGTKGGTPVASTDERYHNNSKYYSEVAHTEADNATTKAQDSEAWAVGKRNGQDVPSTDETYHNNAKYWAEQAEGAVTGNDKVTWEANGVLGAKNLIPYPYYETTKTVNGITFTDNGDGTVTVNGTATSKVNFWLGNYSLPFIYPNGSYLLSDGGVGSSDVSLFFAWYNDTTWVTQNSVFDNGEIPITVSHSASSNYDRTPIGINVKAGTTVSNLTFKPMLRLAEDADGTYQPYAMTNRELTLGKASQAEVNDIVNIYGAKNLIPYPYYEKNYSNNGVVWTCEEEGTISVTGTATARDYFNLTVGNNRTDGQAVAEKDKFNISALVGKTVILSFKVSEVGSNSTFGWGYCVRDSSSTNIASANIYNSNSVAITIPNNAVYMDIFAEVFSGATVFDITFTEPMLRLASDTDSTYQPYAKTNQQLTKDSPFRFGVDGNGNYGYIKAGADTVTPFRNPKGNAVVANVLSGKTFANASSDELTGAMANYSGSNRQTITVSAGTGTQQISLSAGYHDSVIVDRTNAYVAGQNNIRNKEWAEPIEFYDNVWIQREVLTDTVIGYSNPRVGISCSNFSRLVKDAVWGEGDSIFVVGFYEKYQYWENTALGGNHGGIAMSSISTVSDATLGWHPNAIMLTHASNYNDTHGGELRGELTSSSGYTVSHSGTAYLSLYRKGIQ